MLLAACRTIKVRQAASGEVRGLYHRGDPGCERRHAGGLKRNGKNQTVVPERAAPESLERLQQGAALLADAGVYEASRNTPILNGIPALVKTAEAVVKLNRIMLLEKQGEFGGYENDERLVRLSAERGTLETLCAGADQGGARRRPGQYGRRIDDRMASRRRFSRNGSDQGHVRQSPRRRGRRAQRADIGSTVERTWCSA